jgi:hypothetical protein
MSLSFEFCPISPTHIFIDVSECSRINDSERSSADRDEATSASEVSVLNGGRALENRVDLDNTALKHIGSISTTESRTEQKPSRHVCHQPHIDKRADVRRRSGCKRPPQSATYTRQPKPPAATPFGKCALVESATKTRQWMSSECISRIVVLPKSDVSEFTVRYAIAIWYGIEVPPKSDTQKNLIITQDRNSRRPTTKQNPILFQITNLLQCKSHEFIHRTSPYSRFSDF